MADEAATIDLPVVTQSPPKEVAIPDNIRDMNFSIDDFEVEQLPEQPSKVPPKEEKPIAKEDKQIEGAEEKVEDKEEKKEDGLPKFLKPPKTDEKKEEKVEAEHKEAKPAIKPIAPPIKTPRDFTGFSKEEADAGKQMSNEAFSIYQKAIKDRNELKGVTEKSYMQHPQAYVLDPVFQETRAKLSYAQREQQYWEEQLVNMSENGAELVPIEGFDPRTGQPVLGKAMPPSRALEEKVRQCIFNCGNVGRELQGKLAEYPTKYQSNIQNDIQGIENYRKQNFSWVVDPKLLDYSLPIEGLGERTLKQIREDVSAMLPSWTRNHPTTPLIQDLAIGIRMLQAELAELKATNGVAKVHEDEEKLIEPSSKDKPSSYKEAGEMVHGVKEFRIDPSLGI